jgi:hypothetical protein
MIWRSGLVLALVAVLAPACGRQSCDPGQILTATELCMTAPDAARPAPDGGTTSSPDATGLPDATGASCASYAGFGDSCAVASDCPCGLDMCQTFGGKPYCTRTGCKADMSLCPPGWSCRDLSVYMPGLPTVCARP